MSSTRQTSFRPSRPWVRHALLAISLVLSALLAHDLGDDARRPVPAAGDTLARFLPPGANVEDLEPTRTRGVFRFEAASAARRFSGEITTGGTLVRLSAQALPGSPDDAWPWSPAHADGPVLLTAFAARSFPRATSISYVDALGRTLFVPGGDPPAMPAATGVRLESLAPQVVAEVRRHVGPHRPTALGREVALGSRVHVVVWRSPHGRQRAGILDNGLTLFVELPADEPVPAPVSRRLAGADRIQALILFSYREPSPAGDRGQLVLANGVNLYEPSRLAAL